jgi:hypothetical protein
MNKLPKQIQVEKLEKTEVACNCGCSNDSNITMNTDLLIGSKNVKDDKREEDCC